MRSCLITSYGTFEKRFSSFIWGIPVYDGNRIEGEAVQYLTDEPDQANTYSD